MGEHRRDQLKQLPTKTENDKESAEVRESEASRAAILNIAKETMGMEGIDELINAEKCKRIIARIEASEASTDDWWDLIGSLRWAVSIDSSLIYEARLASPSAVRQADLSTHEVGAEYESESAKIALDVEKLEEHMEEELRKAVSDVKAYCQRNSIAVTFDEHAITQFGSIDHNIYLSSIPRHPTMVRVEVRKKSMKHGFAVGEDEFTMSIATHYSLRRLTSVVIFSESGDVFEDSNGRKHSSTELDFFESEYLKRSQ